MTDQWQDSIDPDGPQAADLERFGGEFKTCPSCGSEAYDQAPACPSCGHAFEGSEETSGIPMWAMVIAGGLVVLFVLYSIM